MHNNARIMGRIIIAADPLCTAEALQQNTYKPQNVHQISKHEMKTQETGVKCTVYDTAEQTSTVIHKMSKTIRLP